MKLGKRLLTAGLVLLVVWAFAATTAWDPGLEPVIGIAGLVLTVAGFTLLAVDRTRAANSDRSSDTASGTAPVPHEVSAPGSHGTV